jgi:hypothetical protein
MTLDLANELVSRIVDAKKDRQFWYGKRALPWLISNESRRDILEELLQVPLDIDLIEAKIRELKVKHDTRPLV